MRIGYARVSADDQNLALQNDALPEAGCERIFTDKVSGTKVERIGLNEALQFIREGDTLVVWRLDRPGRSTTELIKTVNELRERKIGFESLTEKIETIFPAGKLHSTYLLLSLNLNVL